MNYKHLKPKTLHLTPEIVRLKPANGFSLMELIVCLFIINLGMVGVLSLVLQNIKVEDVNKNALIAAQLSQEGLELVKNIRDNNWLNGEEWTKNVASTNSASSTYVLDYQVTDNVNSKIKAVSTIDDEKAKLYIDQNGYYVHDKIGTSPTVFSRLISVIDESNTDGKKYLIVSSTVKWKDRGHYNSYTADVYLYDWY